MAEDLVELYCVVAVDRLIFGLVAEDRLSFGLLAEDRLSCVVLWLMTGGLAQLCFGRG